MIPFKTWKLENRFQTLGTAHEGTIRINQMIDGIFDNLDSIWVTINFSTGRITIVEFTIVGEITREIETISDKKVFAKIKEDGPDYDITYDRTIWDPLTYKTNDLIGRGTVLAQNGKVVLVKQRTVEVKRNDARKRYVFRMDGSLLYSQ